MSDWFDKQVDGWIDGQVDRAIDKKVDEFLEPHIGKDRLRQVKKLIEEGRPLDEDTEVMLREYLTEEQLDQYRTIHNGAVKAEKLDKDMKKLDSDLKFLDDLF